MATYLIGFEGRDGNRPYEQVREAMDARGGTRILETLWGLESDDDAATLRDWLHSLMSDEDAIFVIAVKPGCHWATRHVKISVNDWLKTRV